MPSTTTWTAQKAVLRGHLINIASAKNKTKLADIKSLTKDFDNLYNKCNQSQSQNLLNQIQKKKKSLTRNADTEKALRWSKARFMLYSNMASTMFSRKQNHSTKPPHVYKLCKSAGYLVTHPKEVLDLFSVYYKKNSLPLKHLPNNLLGNGLMTQFFLLYQIRR